MRYYFHFNFPQLLTFSILLSLAGGCSTVGDVTSALRIDVSEHPAHQDEQVRFRTTYYFRIVDSCELGEENGHKDYYDKDRRPFKVRQAGKPKIVNDTLYRFRMTGKTSALFAKINFESGVLRAEQIDPFGSKVVLDTDTNEYRVISANVDRENARRNEIVKEIKRLKDLLPKPEETLSDEHKEKTRSLIENMIEKQILLLGNQNDSRLDPSNKDYHIPSHQKGANTNGKNLLCHDGRPTQRSYSLYGPEGVRQLDPDERLLMAMTSDSKPLIGMLQELSGRAVKTQQIHENGYTDIANERARVSNAQRDIESLATRENLTEPEITALIQKLETRFGSK